MQTVDSEAPTWARSVGSYDTVSVLIHWTIFLIVTSVCIIGFLFYKLDYKSELYAQYYYWHRSLGELVFMLVLVSLVWRCRRSAPSEFEDVHWRQMAARWTRFVLVALLIIVPLVKIWRGAYGHMGWTFFWWHIPSSWPQNAALGRFLTEAHYYTAWALIALSTLHSAAALWHHYVRKDGLMNRMKPF